MEPRDSQHISGYFSKFKRFLPMHTETKHRLLKAVKKSTGIMLDNKDVRLVGGVARLSLSPLKKREILMRKQEILEYVWARTGKQFPKDLG